MASHSVSSSRSTEFKAKSCTILLKEGDLLKENAQLIVVSTPEHEENTQYFKIFSVIYEKADRKTKDSIKNLWSKNSKKRLMEIRVEAKNYLLVKTPSFSNDNESKRSLESIFTQCIKFAYENSFKSIAFPAIGTGSKNMDFNEAVRCCFSAIETSTDRSTSKLEQIRIVILDSYEKFVNLFGDMSTRTESKIKIFETYTNLSLDDFLAVIQI